MPNVTTGGRLNAAAIPAILLVGGQGSRLRRILGDIPKALAPVQGRPWLEHQLRHLQRVGFRHVVLAVGVGSVAVRSFVASRPVSGLVVDLSEDGESPLGTGGAIERARTRFGLGLACVINGDTLVWGDWPGFLDRRGDVGDLWLCTVGVGRRQDIDSGNVHVNSRGQVTEWEERGQGAGGWANAGAYVFCEGTPRPIAAGSSFSLEYEWLPYLTSLGGVWTHPMEFYDIGTPGRYAGAGQAIGMADGAAGG